MTSNSERIVNMVERLIEHLAGLNAPPGFAAEVIARIAERTGHPFAPASNCLIRCAMM